MIDLKNNSVRILSVNIVYKANNLKRLLILGVMELLAIKRNDISHIISLQALQKLKTPAHIRRLNSIRRTVSVV